MDGSLVSFFFLARMALESGLRFLACDDADAIWNGVGEHPDLTELGFSQQKKASFNERDRWSDLACKSRGYYSTPFLRSGRVNAEKG